LRRFPRLFCRDSQEFALQVLSAAHGFVHSLEAPMTDHQIKLLHKSTSVGVFSRHRASVLTSLTFLVGMNSAYAAASNGPSPLVNHPTHNLSGLNPAHLFHTLPNLSGASNAPGSTTGGTANNGTATLGSSGSQSSIVGHSHTSGHATTNNSANGGKVVNTAVHALTTTGTSTPANSNSVKSNLSLPSGGYQLDLSSSAANVVLGSSLFGHNTSVTINVGGANQTFSAGQKVTAAEYVAIQQTLGSSHSQSLVLNSQGAADAGKFSLNSAVNANVTELVVPTGVTATDTLSKGNSVTIAGDLLNYGSIYGVSTGNTTAGAITAANITNEKGGLISTVVPIAVLSSINNANSGATNLTLNAQNNFTNAGAITSSGALTLASVNGSINNSSGGTVTAANNVNLSSGTGILSNAGTISSKSGNINITGPASSDLNINAGGGSFQAIEGNINLRTPSYTGNNNINLTGGDYLSKNLNVYSGSGAINGNVGNVSGNLNTVAGGEHLLASAATLNLGLNTVNGDPIFANTTGNIAINNTNTFTEGVAILAAGFITDNNTSAEIVTGGANVLMVAGVVITSVQGGGGSVSAIPPITSSTSQVVLQGVSTNGGFINLQTNSTTPVIDTSGTTTGGNVTLAAFHQTGSTSGFITLNNTAGVNSITTAGGVTGGNVTIIAGGVNGVGLAVTGGSILTSGGTQSGNVNIFTAQPVTNSGTPNQATVIESATPGVGAVLQSGSTITPGSAASNAAVTLGNIVTAGANGVPNYTAAPSAGGNAGTIFIDASGAVTVGNLLAFGGGGAGGTGSSGPAPAFAGASGGAGTSISVIGAALNINGQINSSGGGGGGGGGGGATGGAVGSGGAGGAAGTISLQASGAIALAAPVLAAGGGAGAPGGLGSSSSFAGGGGGGGGGSYGGGGGGGGGGFGGNNGVGGGGGGGFFGGGGGEGGNENQNGGGGGGGATSGGVGGTGGGSGVNGTAGSANAGGSSGSYGPFAGQCGTLSHGGSGGGPGAGGSSGVNGSSVPTTATSGNTISITGDGITTSTGGVGKGLIFGQNVTLADNVGGGVSVQDSVTGTSTVTVSTVAAGAITQPGGTISAPTVTLTAGTGAIGTLVLPIETGNNGNSITVHTTSTGNAFVTDTTSSLVNLGTSSDTLLELTATNAINVSGTWTGNAISLKSTTSSVTAPNGLTVTAGSGGNGGTISITAATNAVVTGNLTANSTGSGTGGFIGVTTNSSQPFTIGSATANSVSGSVSTLGASSTTNGSITLTNLGAGGVTNTEAISNVNSLSLASVGPISIGPQLGQAGTNSINLLTTGAGGNITYTSTRNVIVANTVTLASGGTIGTSTSSLILNAPNVTLENAGGLVTITDVSNGETVGNGGASGTIAGTLGYLGTGPITFTGNLQATGTMSIVNSNTLGVSNGNLTINNSLTASGAGSTLNLITNGSGNINGTGSATATNVNLTTGSGTIGTNFTTPFNVNATNVAPTTTGLASISDLVGMTLTGSGISGASSVSLSTNTGNIVIQGQVGNDATGAVKISAFGNITASADIHGGPLTLISLVGNIGTLNAGALPIVSTNFNISATTGFSNVIDTQTSTAVTMSSGSALSSFTFSFAGPGPFNLPSVTALNGPIFVADSGNVTLGSLSAATNITVFTQSFVGATVGNITVNGPIAAGIGGGTGFVNLDALKNMTSPGPNSLILVNPSASITANNSHITLEQDNTTNGSIVIGTNASISTTGATGGAVNVVIGAVPVTPVVGTAPANAAVTHPGAGTVSWGTNSISIPTGKANIVLDGSNIVFNTGTLPATAIVLGNGVTITADPTSPLLQMQPQASLVDTLRQSGPIGPASLTPPAAVELQSVNGQTSTLATSGADLAHVINAGTSFSGNAGLASAVNSTPIVAALSANTITPSMAATADTTNTLNASDEKGGAGINAGNASALLNSSPRAIESQWISDTELSTGQIPAVLSSDQEFGITPQDSSVVEMAEQELAAEVDLNVDSSLTARLAQTANPKLNATPVVTAKPGIPLTGSVNRTIGGAHSVNLNRGSVIFAPSRDTLVNTPFGKVKIDARSVVLMMVFRDGLAVFDVDDVHGKAVVVKAGDQELTLNPGMHATITRESVDSFEQVNPAQLIGYRHLHAQPIGQGLKAFVSEFSVMQATNAVTPLKQIINSNRDSARRTANHMLKTAAILQQLNGGNFEQVMRPSLAAYASNSESGTYAGSLDR
jgi:mucin-19